METRMITLTQGFRLPSLFNEEQVSEIYSWLSTWKLGPRDTSWRFHNSLQDGDVQTLTKGKYYVSPRPGDSSKSGYLCIYPPLKCVVYVEHSKSHAKARWPRIYLLRIRVDPHIWLSAGIVYAATMSITEKTLVMEDLLMYKGEQIWSGHDFSRRWTSLQKSLQEDLFLDEDLQGGLQLRLRDIRPLKDIQKIGVWDILPEEAGKRRYLWIGADRLAPASESKKEKEQEKEQDNLATATKGAFPDQYFLTRGDTKLGMAIIQNNEISKDLRIKSKTQPSMKVQIQSSNEFEGSWEIISVM
jgi:hypothetical protein